MAFSDDEIAEQFAADTLDGYVAAHARSVSRRYLLGLKTMARGEVVGAVAVPDQQIARERRSMRDRMVLLAERDLLREEQRRKRHQAQLSERAARQAARENARRARVEARRGATRDWSLHL